MYFVYMCVCTIPNVGKPQFGFWEEEEEKRENTENWGQTCPVITKLYQHTHTHLLGHGELISTVRLWIRFFIF